MRGEKWVEKKWVKELLCVACVYVCVIDKQPSNIPPHS